MRRICVLPLLLAAWGGPSFSVLMAVEFQLVPAQTDVNQFRIGLVLNEFFEDDDTADVTGMLQIDLSWDVVGDDISLTGQAITSSTLSFSPVEFTLGFPPFGVDITGTGLGGELTTPNPPSAVANGSFDAADHLLTINEGLFVVTGLIEDVFDISTLPFSGSGAGQGTIGLTELGRTPSQIEYEALIAIPISFTQRVLDFDAGDAADMDLEVTGNVVAVGQFTALLSPGESNPDFDRDGDVDGADFVAWQRGFGVMSGALPADGDANLDEAVDTTDLSAWAGEFGAVTGLVAAAVPEPGSWLLAMLVMVTCRRVRCSARGHVLTF